MISSKFSSRLLSRVKKETQNWIGILASDQLKLRRKMFSNEREKHTQRERERERERERGR